LEPLLLLLLVVVLVVLVVVLRHDGWLQRIIPRGVVWDACCCSAIRPRQGLASFSTELHGDCTAGTLMLTRCGRQGAGQGKVPMLVPREVSACPAAGHC
jgi:hypothetical protein